MAKLSPPSGRRGRPGGVRPWTLVVLGFLLLASVLGQACSDNSGTSRPKFAGGPAATTGFANTADQINVVVGINPNSITPGQRAGVTAFVTNDSGLPLAGKLVQFSTDVGTLDTTVGTTNSRGQFSTFLRISPVEAANAPGRTAKVMAFVEGATPAEGTVNFGPVNVDTGTTIAITPSSVNRAQANVGGVCNFAVQFTAIRAIPPVTFTSGVPGAVSSGGLYVARGVPAGDAIQDTVTATDSTGRTASTGNLMLTCN